MRTLIAILFSGVIATMAGAAIADEKAVKEHEEMGKKDVYPEGRPETKK